jgi:YVTN family beta-propeller protein
MSQTQGSLAAAQQSGNRGIELWAISAGHIWTLYQTTPGGAWSHWEGPGFKNQPAPMTSVAAAGQNNGRVELFTLDQSGRVWGISQQSPGGDWGPWSGPNFGNQPQPFLQIAAAEQGGNRGVELWATNAEGQIWTLYQKTPGGPWSNWEGPGFKGQPVPMIRMAAAGENTGSVQLFTLDSSGNVWGIRQQSPGGDWGPWSGPRLANQPVTFVQISAAQQSGNRGVELWATEANGQIWTLYQITPGGPWSSWEGPGFKHQPVPFVDNCAAGQNTGNVMLVALQAGSIFWGISQGSPGGDWGPWAKLPPPPLPTYSFTPLPNSPVRVPKGAAFVAASAGLVYALNGQYITVLNARTLEGITGSPFQISTNPQAALFSAAVSADGSRLYVADFSGEIWALNAQTLQVVTKLPVPAGGPISIALSPNGASVYVANRLNNTLWALSTPSLEQLPGSPVSFGPVTSGGPTSVAASRDGALIYVTNTSGNCLWVLDAATLKPATAAPIPVGASPSCVAVSPDSRHVYVTNQGSNNLTVLAVGGSSGQYTFTPVAGSPFAVGAAPVAVAASPDGALVYVVNQGDNNLAVLYAQTLQQVTPPIALGTRPNSVAVSPDGSLVYVANANDSSLTAIAVASTFE